MGDDLAGLVAFLRVERAHRGGGRHFLAERTQLGSLALRFWVGGPGPVLNLAAPAADRRARATRGSSDTMGVPRRAHLAEDLLGLVTDHGDDAVGRRCG